MAEEVFKNVQVLKGIPVDEFMGTMGFFSAALGMNCTDCHVDESGGSWAKYADDNDLKRTARRMVQMVAAHQHRRSFAGRQVVTCNTCHRGSSSAQRDAEPGVAVRKPPPDEPGEPIRTGARAAAADQVLDKYLQAVGGAERLAELTSFVAKGTYKGFDDAERARWKSLPGRRASARRSSTRSTATARPSSTAAAAGSPRRRPRSRCRCSRSPGRSWTASRLEAELVFPGRDQAGA